MSIELMAPANDLNCLLEAFACGADSVYFGMKKYSARSVSINFDFEDVASAVKYSHELSKRVYLALNTLIKDKEFDNALYYAKYAINAGIDGIIVQDIGLGMALLQLGIPIFASTQMTITNSRGVNVVKQLGYKRVVLARELNIIEIQEICSKCSDIELECFIHGGLCIGYSGQCNISSLFHNSASNRGICRTPCWEEYTLYCNNIPLNSGRLLHPKDMFGIDKLPILINAGINAIKIQGRTRNLEYIHDVVTTYKKYLDNIDTIQTEEVLSAYSIMSKHSPRGLMHGNLDTSVNSSFVVDQFSSTIPLQKYYESYSVQKCQKAEHISVCFYDISRITVSELLPIMDRIYLPLECFNENNKQKILGLSKIAPLYLIIPTLIERYDVTYDYIEKILYNYHVTGLSISNIGDLSFLDNISSEYSTEKSLNICNKQSVSFFKKYGVTDIAFPLELSDNECSVLSRDNSIMFEKIIYGRPPLVSMKYCLLSHSNECTHCEKCSSNNTYILSGSNSFLVSIHSNRMESTLFPLKKIALPVLVLENCLFRFEFTDETVSHINRIMTLYRSGYYPSGDYYTRIGSE